MSVQALYDQGFAARCEGRYGDARELLSRVLALEPGHADAAWQMGLIMGFEGDFDGSIASLEALVRKHPTQVGS